MDLLLFYNAGCMNNTSRILGSHHELMNYKISIFGSRFITYIIYFNIFI